MNTLLYCESPFLSKVPHSKRPGAAACTDVRGARTRRWTRFTTCLTFRKRLPRGNTDSEGAVR